LHHYVVQFQALQASQAQRQLPQAAAVWQLSAQRCRQLQAAQRRKKLRRQRLQQLV